MADETSDRDASQPWTIPGKLESDAQGTVFDQCRIEVFFEVETPIAGARPVEIVAASGEDAGDESVDVRNEPALVRSRAAALSDEDGAFSLELPPRDRVGPTLRFVVSAPSGETVADHELTRTRLQPPVRLKIRRVKPVEVGEATALGGLTAIGVGLWSLVARPEPFGAALACTAVGVGLVNFGVDLIARPAARRMSMLERLVKTLLSCRAGLGP
jgi:hypothetical protein